MGTASLEKAAKSRAEMDAAEAEKAAKSQAEMDAAEMEKAAKSPAEITAEMEKAARMEKAAKLRAHREAARRRHENYMRRTGMLTPPGVVFLDRTNCDSFDIDGFLGLNRYGADQPFVPMSS